MATALNPNGNPVRIGNVTLRTPGLAGTAPRCWPPRAPAARASRAVDPDASKRRSPAPGSCRRRRSRSPPPAGRRAGRGQRALDQHRRAGDGGHRSGRRRGLGAVPARAGRVRGRPPGISPSTRRTGWTGPQRHHDADLRLIRHAPGRSDRRGARDPRPRRGDRQEDPEGAGLPLLDPGGRGRARGRFVHRWEAQRPAAPLPLFPPRKLWQRRRLPTSAAEDWARLSGGRALLMIHGTVSRTEYSVRRPVARELKALHERYEGRVFAFDHSTLSEDPRQNVGWFFRQSRATRSSTSTSSATPEAGSWPACWRSGRANSRRAAAR